MLSNLKQAFYIPEVMIPAVLVMASILAVYAHRNLDKFKRSFSRLKDSLEYEAMNQGSIFGKYKVSRATSFKLGRLKAPFNYQTFFIANAVFSLLMSAISYRFLTNLSLAVLIPVLWMLFVHQLIDKLYRTRVKAKSDAQAQLVFQLLAEIYNVSDNLPQAIERVIPSTPQPLKGDLERLVLQVATNEDLNNCLIDFASNIDNNDIETFVHGIILSDQFGTDAHEVITKNAEVIRERIALREELINETRGKKAIISIFMVVLPIMFLWLFSSNPDARAIFTGSPKGQWLVTVLVFVEYACWYFDSRKGVAEEL